MKKVLFVLVLMSCLFGFQAVMAEKYATCTVPLTMYSNKPAKNFICANYTTADPSIRAMNCKTSSGYCWVEKDSVFPALQGYFSGLSTSDQCSNDTFPDVGTSIINPPVSQTSDQGHNLSTTLSLKTLCEVRNCPDQECKVYNNGTLNLSD